MLSESLHGWPPFSHAIWEKGAWPSCGNYKIPPTVLDFRIPPVLNAIMTVFVEGMFRGSLTHHVLLP